MKEDSYDKLTRFWGARRLPMQIGVSRSLRAMRQGRRIQIQGYRTRVRHRALATAIRGKRFGAIRTGEYNPYPS